MSKDDERRGSNEPEDSAKRRCEEEEGYSNDEQASIEVLLRDSSVTHLERVCGWYKVNKLKRIT